MTHPALIERITRSLAYMLRHQPERFDVEVDSFGWADIDEVIRALNERLGESVVEDDLENAIQSGDRQRYELDGDRIRALYGHSIDIEPGEPDQPPEHLYLAIPARDLDRAMRFGLRGGRRRFVHLALTEDDAREAGRRMARKYTILMIHAMEAWEDGVNFFDRRSLFLAEEVPTHMIEVGETYDDGDPPRMDDDRRGRGRRRPERSERRRGRRDEEDEDDRPRGRDRDRDERPAEDRAERTSEGRSSDERGDEPRRDRDGDSDERRPRRRGGRGRGERGDREERGERGERDGGARRSARSDREERPSREERPRRSRSDDRDDRPRRGRDERPAAREERPAEPAPAKPTRKPAPAGPAFGAGLEGQAAAQPEPEPEPVAAPAPEPAPAPVVEPEPEAAKDDGPSGFGAGL